MFHPLIQIRADVHRAKRLANRTPVGVRRKSGGSFSQISRISGLAHVGEMHNLRVTLIRLSSAPVASNLPSALNVYVTCVTRPFIN